MHFYYYKITRLHTYYGLDIRNICKKLLIVDILLNYNYECEL